jgi:hypothetical protein
VPAGLRVSSDLDGGQAGSWVHPRCLGASDMQTHLTGCAVRQRVAASTQNQALNALVFLLRDVLRRATARTHTAMPSGDGVRV